MSGPMNFKRKPWRSEKYKRFVVSLRCGNPRCSATSSNAHHENEQGHSTMAGKCCDSRMVPLCPFCHTDRHNKGRGVWTIWRVDPEELIRQTQEAWVRERGSRPWET